MEFNIVVINDCGCLIAYETVEAESENEALIDFLNDFNLATGDQISINQGAL